MSEYVPMTRDGYNRIKAEIDRLENEEMPRISEKIAEARAEGDLKENAEYHAQRENQGMTQSKINALKTKLKNAHIIENPSETRPLVARIYDPAMWHRSSPLPVLVKGTNFQIKVWEALLRIPVGTVVTYEDIALHIGLPKAVRAVGNAVEVRELYGTMDLTHFISRLAPAFSKKNLQIF